VFSVFISILLFSVQIAGESHAVVE